MKKTLISKKNLSLLYLELKKITGLSFTNIWKIFGTLGINKKFKIKSINREKIKIGKHLKEFLMNLIKKNKLSYTKETMNLFIKEKQLKQTYVGWRHKYKLPVRNQRTKTNAKTKRKKK